GVDRGDRAAGELAERRADVEQEARWPLGQPERLVRALGDLAQLFLAGLELALRVEPLERAREPRRAEPEQLLARQRRVERSLAEHRDQADDLAVLAAQRHAEIAVRADLGEHVIFGEQLLQSIRVVADAAVPHGLARRAD